jgi:hypothetical protein
MLAGQNEMKTDVSGVWDDVKNFVRAVNTIQEEMKNDIEGKIENSVSAMGTKTKRWPRRIETWNKCFQDKICATQAKFEERNWNAGETAKGCPARVKQQPSNFSMSLVLCCKWCEKT